MRPNDLLSSQTLEMVDDPSKAEAYRDTFKRLGVVQINDFADSSMLLQFGDQVWNELSPYWKESKQSHEIVKSGRISGLSTGFKFHNVDPIRHRGESRDALVKKYKELGLVEIGRELGEMLTPLIQYIIDEPLPYKRVFCFLYCEGDYISPHNDHQTGHRVNAQFPVPMSAVTGFRAMGEDGRLEVYYDKPGCLRILGPFTWHEVLPVLRLTEDVEPRRFLFSLRYMN